MTEFFKAIFLGAVQGVTEFLPISSTGHLIIAEHILGISQETYGLTFDAALHIGSLIAVFWYFKEDWKKLLRSFISVILDLIQDPKVILKLGSLIHGNDKICLLLILGTIPAVFIGLLFENAVETAFRSPTLVAFALIIFSFVLLFVERVGRKYKKMETLTFVDSLVVGFAQSIALIPGVSRSGITMASGMWRGLTREEAARFAFLLSAPIIAGAGGKKLIDTITVLFHGQMPIGQFGFFITGMVSAAIVGYLTIKYFLKYISNHSLYPFIIYRIVIGIVILLVLAV